MGTTIRQMMKSKRNRGAGMATAFLLVLLMLLMPKGAAFAEDENDGIDLIDNPSIPVIVLHIDETQGATIDEMNADQEHKTEE